MCETQIILCRKESVMKITIIQIRNVNLFRALKKEDNREIRKASESQLQV